jgi:hypothetical protein
MNLNPDPKREGHLLDAVLRDERWQAASAAFKAQALAAFRARQRVRWLTRSAGWLVAVAALVVAGLHWLNRSAPPPQPVAVPPAEARSNSGLPRYLSDQELLALFPKGSCFLAEVDGKKELVFLVPEVERQYVSHAGQIRSLAR